MEYARNFELIEFRLKCAVKVETTRGNFLVEDASVYPLVSSTTYFSVSAHHFFPFTGGGSTYSLFLPSDPPSALTCMPLSSSTLCSNSIGPSQELVYVQTESLPSVIVSKAAATRL